MEGNGEPRLGGPGEDISFSLSITSLEAEPCRDLRDTGPVREPRGWWLCCCVRSPWVCPPARAGSGPALGPHAQVVLLRLGLGLQIQVLQTLVSLRQADPKPWIPPSQKFGSGAKGDSWPLLPSWAKLKSGSERRHEEPGSCSGAERVARAPSAQQIGFPEIAC